MEMTEIFYHIIMFLNCIFEIFLLYNFLEALFPLYEDRKWLIKLEAFGCITAIYLINDLHIPLLNLVCVPVIYLLFVWLIFRIQLKSSLVFVVLYYFILAISEFAFSDIYTMLGVQTITVSFRRIFLLTMQDALRFIIIQIFKRKFSGTYRGGINKYTRSLFILPVTVFILLNGFLMPVRYPYGYLLTSIGGILLIVCSIINFSVIDKLLEAENELKMNELLKLKTTLEQTHYQSLQEINKEYAAHIHDIRHILKIIQRLDETGDDEKIHEISDKVTELLKNKCPLDRKFCMEDSVINAIFMERGKKAAEGGVKFTADIQPNVELDFICDIDKIRIFGNLLDNAIEAAILCNNGYVTVSLYRGNDSIVIFRVENNFEHKNKKHGKAYITTKSDKTRHGFGLKNVKELSEKYNGIMKITEENDVFFITLILSNIQKMEI